MLVCNYICNKLNLTNGLGGEIDTFIQTLDKEDRGCIGFNQFFRAIKHMLDYDDEPDTTPGTPGERPKSRNRPRSTSWVAPESVCITI